MPLPSQAQNVSSNNTDIRACAPTILEGWLQRRLKESDYDWLQSQLTGIAKANSDRNLHIAMGLIPRKLGRDDLTLSDSELQEANDYSAGWRPINWSLDTTARVWILSHQTDRGSEQFGELIRDLCRTADLAELIAIYCGLPVYPSSTSLDKQVAEGLRSNIKSVFEAIAHYNPYPAMHFSENRWNHMVLKALFVDSRLSPVVGLDDRTNEALADTLCDYAHERWAAGRAVTFELWRCVGPNARQTHIDDLAKVVKQGSLTEQRAALLALSNSDRKSAQDILETRPRITQQINSGVLTWATIESL